MIIEKQRNSKKTRIAVSIGPLLGLLIGMSIVGYLTYTIVHFLVVLAVDAAVAGGMPVVVDKNVAIVGSKPSNVAFVDHTIETMGAINTIDIGNSKITTKEIMVSPDGIWEITLKGKKTVKEGDFIERLQSYQSETTRFFWVMSGEISYCLEGYDNPFYGCDIRKGSVLLYQQ